MLEQPKLSRFSSRAFGRALYEVQVGAREFSEWNELPDWRDDDTDGSCIAMFSVSLAINCQVSFVQIILMSFGVRMIDISP